MNHILLPYLSKACNAYLRLDPESDQRLNALKGNVVTIELLPFHFIFQCEFTAAGIHLEAGETSPAMTKIKGTPLQMMGAMLAKEQRQRFFADDLVIEGNADIGLQLIDLFDAMQIDWEEYLSQVTGDTPAHHIGRAIRGFKKWLDDASLSLTDNVSDYLQEEKQWLPSREALQDFFEDIDTARMDTDRLEARINRLTSHFAKDKHHHEAH